MIGVLQGLSLYGRPAGMQLDDCRDATQIRGVGFRVMRFDRDRHHIDAPIDPYESARRLAPDRGDADPTSIPKGAPPCAFAPATAVHAKPVDPGAFRVAQSGVSDGGSYHARAGNR